MTDYLDSIARRAVDPVTEVRPAFAPLFAATTFGDNNWQNDAETLDGRRARVEASDGEDRRSLGQSKLDVVADASPVGPPAPALADAPSRDAPTPRPPVVDPPLSLRRHQANTLVQQRFRTKKNLRGEIDKRLEPDSIAIAHRIEGQYLRGDHEKSEVDMTSKFGKVSGTGPETNHPAVDRQPELVNRSKATHMEIQTENFDLSRQEILELSRQRERPIPEIVPQSTIATVPPVSEPSRALVNPIRQPAGETIVQVTIGRVEVRGHVGEQNRIPVRQAERRESLPGLAEYLRGTVPGRLS